MRQPPACLLTALACLIVLAAAPSRANVYGDGDPRNGSEDSRDGSLGPDGGPPGGAWRLGAGAVHCDGEIRGSAVMLDVSAISRRVEGAFIATAAHVLVDLLTGRPFERCRFDFMALDQLPFFQAAIEPAWTVAGNFDPLGDTRQPGFGRGDWAFIHLPDGVPGAGRLHGLAAGSYRVPDAAVEPSDFRLVAFDREAGRMALSGQCRVLESTPADLGGGAWRGQLLDDCDSGPGASGGGLLTTRDGKDVLVGIRSGSHWSADAWPPEHFPDGPPAGAPWDAAANTNFARALDGELLEQLEQLVRRAERSQRD